MKQILFCAQSLLFIGAQSHAQTSNIFAQQKVPMLQKLQKYFGQYETSNQAVLIIPIIEDQSSRPSNRKEYHTRNYDFLRHLRAQGLQAHILYDTSKRNMTLETIAHNVDSIQKLYRYKTVSIINFAHGTVVHRKDKSGYDPSVLDSIW